MDGGGGGGGGGERAEEDLEIASIGSLYSGPWHKKYWSSSRGKDRYPYPIGYNAIRTYAGNIYGMEIHEGLQGPLFVVTCDDGDSGSGQTPDIAWGNLLKKCGPRVKNWQGKRFSSKIDGVEFFGFRNPFVQRLFRELLANIGGKAESSLVSPEFCHGAMQTGSDIHIHESRTNPDLLPYIGKKQSTRKRTMKAKHAAKSANTAARSKRLRYQDIGHGSSYGNSKPGDELCSHAPNKSAMNLWTKETSSTTDGPLVTVGNATTSKLVGLECQNNELTTGTSVKNAEENRDPEYSLAPVSLSVMVAGNCSAFQPESKLVKAVEPDFFVEKHVIFQEQRHFLRPGDSRPCSMEYKIHQADNIKLDWLLDAEVEERISSVAPEDSTEKILTLPRTSGVCVPDSLDTPKDNNMGSMDNIEESLCSMKDQHVTDSPLLETSKSFFKVVTEGMPEDFINETQNRSSKCTNRMPEEVPDHVYSMPGDDLSKGLAIEALLDVSSSSGSSNASFGKTDLDSAGQELARSMMTFLLPRALPLLKKTYKRRSKNRNGKTKDRLAGENVESFHPTDISCQDKLTTEMPVQRQEKNIQDMNIQPGNGSPCDITKVEYHTSTDTINQPFTERGNQKDVQSVIPDSFEDGSCACDVPRKRSSDYSFLKSNIQPSNVVKHNIDGSKLPTNDAEQNKKSSYCQFGSSGCSRVVMMPDELKRGIDITSGLPFVEVEPSHVKNNSNLHFEGERICDTEENINFSYMPRKNISRNDKTEHFEQCCAILELTSTHCRDDNIPKTCPPQSFGVSGSPPVAKNHISIGQHLVNSEPANLDSRYANFPIQVDSVYNPQTELDAKVTGKGNSYSLVSVQETVNSTTGPSSDCLKAGKLLHPLASSIANNVPLSESIICRNFCDSNPPETYCVLEINREDSEVRSTSEVVNNVANAKGQRDVSETVANNPTSEVSLLAAAPIISQINYVSQNVSKNIKSSGIIDPTVPYLEKNSLHDVNDFCNSGEGHFNKAHYQDWCKASCDKIEDLAMEVFVCADKDNLTGPTIYDDCKKLSNTRVCRESHLNGSSNKEATCNIELKSPMELAGCYVHPGPVSSISLISKDDHLQICVECGHLEYNFTYIFIYVIPLHVPKGANPSFIGYTSLVRGSLSSQNLFERPRLQFTPDARSLVFPSSIKAPCCRVQNVDCLCSNCKSDCFEENAIRIVHVEFGYISVIAKLTTSGTVTCILVSEPNFLIAAEKSGRLHVWSMDLTWSVSLEEFKLPSFDHISPVIIELKSVPKCKAIIIGHNGQGGFGLWDISNRVLLARFCTPGNMIFQMLPIGLFSRNKNFSLATISKIEEHIKEVLLTDDQLFEICQNRFPLSPAEDISVWLLVSSVFESEAQDENKMKEPKSSQVGWRLALASKNMVIMGSSLDPRASAINTSAHSGIIGTCDGDVYLWELATGKRLKKLHSFPGGVSCIAVDDKSGVVAVASDNGQLLVYLKQNCELNEYKE